MGGGIVREITECRAEAGGGLSGLTQGQKGDAEIEVEEGRLGIEGQRSAKPRHGLVGVAALGGDHAKQVMGIGMARVGLQDLPIKLLGQLEVAGIIKIESTVELLHLALVVDSLTSQVHADSGSPRRGSTGKASRNSRRMACSVVLPSRVTVSGLLKSTRRLSTHNAKSFEFLVLMSALLPRVTSMLAPLAGLLALTKKEITDYCIGQLPGQPLPGIGFASERIRILDLVAVRQTAVLVARSEFHLHGEGNVSSVHVAWLSSTYCWLHRSGRAHEYDVDSRPVRGRRHCNRRGHGNLAMGAGKRAAAGMLEYMGILTPTMKSSWWKQETCNLPSSVRNAISVLEEDEICCAQVRYTWRCKRLSN